MRGWLQRVPFWLGCIQLVLGGRQWARSWHLCSEMHQPQLKRGSALRHRPQLGRCAQHLYRIAAGTGGTAGGGYGEPGLLRVPLLDLAPVHANSALGGKLLHPIFFFLIHFY